MAAEFPRMNGPGEGEMEKGRKTQNESCSLSSCHDLTNDISSISPYSVIRSQSLKLAYTQGMGNHPHHLDKGIARKSVVYF